MSTNYVKFAVGFLHPHVATDELLNQLDRFTPELQRIVKDALGPAEVMFENYTWGINRQSGLPVQGGQYRVPGDSATALEANIRSAFEQFRQQHSDPLAQELEIHFAVVDDV